MTRIKPTTRNGTYTPQLKVAFVSKSTTSRQARSKPDVERAFRVLNAKIEALASVAGRQRDLQNLVAVDSGREFIAAESDPLFRSLQRKLNKPANPAGPDTNGGPSCQPTS